MGVRMKAITISLENVSIKGTIFGFEVVWMYARAFIFISVHARISYRYHSTKEMKKLEGGANIDI